MAAPTFQNFAQLVQNMSAAVQAKNGALVDFSEGSENLAFAEAVAMVALWLEGLAVYAIAFARAQTCRGTDLDSWMAQFSFPRLSPSPSSGDVVFSRFTSTSTGLVPVGTTVKTIDGTQSFTVVISTANTSYSTTLNGYVLPIGISQVNVPVVANSIGSVTNVQPGTIGLITSETPGVDTVNNVTALTGGADAETDESYLARFPAYIASLSKGTRLAIQNSVASLQLGAECNSVENVDTAGNVTYGYFYSVVDDGTGTPSPTFMSNAVAAIENTRALGVRYGVVAPIVIGATISLAIGVAFGYDKNQVAGIVSNAITTYINSLLDGQTLPYTKIAQVAYDASSGVVSVEDVLVNGDDQDINGVPRQVIKAATVSVSVLP